MRLGVGPPPMGVKDLSLIGVDGVGVEGEFKEKRLWWRQRDDVDTEREGDLRLRLPRMSPGQWVSYLRLRAAGEPLPTAQCDGDLVADQSCIPSLPDDRSIWQGAHSW